LKRLPQALTVAFLLLALFVPSRGHTDPPLRFIVNKANPAVSIGRRDLIDYYEKKRREWPDGIPVRFIDRNGGSSERQSFLRDFLHSSESDVDLFWFSQKIRSGTSVPVQVSNDDIVIEMVKSFRGAIGYVSPSADLKGEGVKEIKIVESGGG
jgi:ABC-type phosphate transport system substrate-binding protein